MDREAWWATVHGVAKTWTQFSEQQQQTATRSHPLSRRVPWELHRRGLIRTGFTEGPATSHSHKRDHLSLMYFRRQSIPRIEVDKQ